jgi:hypothetical protein
MLDAFEKAYSPPGERFTTIPATQIKPLTAVEHAKADVIDKFNGCGYLSLSGANAGPQTMTTGYRKYKCALGTNCKWMASENPNKGQISTDGTIGELIAQATGDKTAAEDFIKRRIYQIKPDADAGEIAAVLAKPVPLGGEMYIYMDQTTKAIKFDNNAPPGRTSAPTQVPDGTEIKYITPNINAQDNFVNAKHENGIHNRMYTCTNGQVSVQDQALLTPSSGWNNMLGEIKFTETVQNSQAYYCCPD